MRLLTFSCCTFFFMTCGSLQTNAQSDSIPALKDTAAFVKVEYESHFPGGQSAWMEFMRAHFKYPDKAVKKNIQGTVIVEFIVDKDGSISSIKAISGPVMLRQTAVNIIKESPPWTPAFQDGHPLRSYKKQPFVFKLED